MKKLQYVDFEIFIFFFGMKVVHLILKFNNYFTIN